MEDIQAKQGVTMASTCIYHINEKTKCNDKTEPNQQYCLSHLKQITLNNVQYIALQIAEEQLSVSSSEIKMTDNLVDDLGADSLDIVELVMMAEEVFDLKIPNEKIEKLLTPQVIIEYIYERLIESERYLLSSEINYERTRYNLIRSQHRIHKILKKIIESEFIKEYCSRLQFKKTTFDNLFFKAVRNSWIDHVTTISNINDRSELKSVYILLLTPKAILSFHLTNKSVQFDSFPLKLIHLSYSFTYDRDGKINSIEVTTSLPAHLNKEAPTFLFSDEVGITGAMRFFSKTLRNQEIIHGE